MTRITKLIFIYTLFTTALMASELTYEVVKLKSMPKVLQATIARRFHTIQLKPVFTGLQGSKALGINMMFSDAFLSSKVLVKFGTRGNYALNKIYKMTNGYVYHHKIKNDHLAFYFENINLSMIESIIKNIQQIKVSQSSLFSIIDSAHADNECFSSDLYPKISADATVAERASGSLLANCMSAAGEGFEESTIGFAKDIWSEGKKLLTSPFKTVTRYYEGISKAIKPLWSFAKAIGTLMVDPQEGMKLLMKGFGEVGAFFIKAYKGIQSLSTEEKTSIICNILGSVGPDILIMAFTLGAGGAKLAATTARLLLKLKKITSILGKGLKVPFKILEQLSDKTMDKIKMITSKGSKKDLEDRLKAVGCAI
jgi:hypothetical protein